jgi:hypothetical protein
MNFGDALYAVDPPVHAAKPEAPHVDNVPAVPGDTKAIALELAETIVPTGGDTLPISGRIIGRLADLSSDGMSGRSITLPRGLR